MSAGDLLFGSIVVWGSECPATRIELVADVIRGTGAPSWLNLFFNGPRSAEILDSPDAKLPQVHLLRTSFHYQPAENWMNELQGFCAFGTMLMLCMYVTTYFLMAGSCLLCGIWDDWT